MYVITEVCRNPIMNGLGDLECGVDELPSGSADPVDVVLQVADVLRPTNTS